MIEKYLILFLVSEISTEPVKNITKLEEQLPGTRRILRGREVGDTRPYMVYLRPADTITTIKPGWLCGGVIIDDRHILTSAACIEDVKHFYVVSGTNKYIDTNDKLNDCVNNGAKKAIWKCVSSSNMYNGEYVDNIRWMTNDLAVVQVEDDFNFERRIKGCDYIPMKIGYNNLSDSYEKSGTVGSIAGWGSTIKFGNRRQAEDQTMNSKYLLETDVVVLAKKGCKKRWDPRYHYIIDDYMICTIDASDRDSSICKDTEVNCKELVYSEEGTKEMVDNTRREVPPIVDAKHANKTRRITGVYGGFCENDHGGPLIMGQGKSSIVVGIQSACLTKGTDKKCAGPFLYTSVYNHRNLIACAITKELGADCKSLLRSVEATEYYWKAGASADLPSAVDRQYTADKNTTKEDKTK